MRFVIIHVRVRKCSHVRVRVYFTVRCSVGEDNTSCITRNRSAPATLRSWNQLILSTPIEVVIYTNEVLKILFLTVVIHIEFGIFTCSVFGVYFAVRCSVGEDIIPSLSAFSGSGGVQLLLRLRFITMRC
jgi:hypothetical protein